MIYRYECPKCSHITENVQSITEELLKTFPCEECGTEAKKLFEMGGLLIPESFRATSELYGSDDYSNPAVLGPALNRSRPSGKTKIFY